MVQAAMRRDASHRPRDLDVLTHSRIAGDHFLHRRVTAFLFT